MIPIDNDIISGVTKRWWLKIITVWKMVKGERDEMSKNKDSMRDSEQIRVKMNSIAL